MTKREHALWRRLYRSLSYVIDLWPVEIESSFKPGWIGQMLEDIQVTNDNAVPMYVREPFDGRAG